MCNLQNPASVMKSAYNLGLAVTSAARSQGGSCVPIYIGDRHIGPLFGSPAESSLPPSRSLAETMYHVLPTYRGRLFYWHREIAGLMFLTDNQVLKPALDYDGCNQWHHERDFVPQSWLQLQHPHLLCAVGTQPCWRTLTEIFRSGLNAYPWVLVAFGPFLRPPLIWFNGLG